MCILYVFWPVCLQYFVIGHKLALSLSGFITLPWTDLTLDLCMKCGFSLPYCYIQFSLEKRPIDVAFV